jgi:hypothetical protein
MDLVIHPRDHDLVIGTHGRAVFILDDVAPLREVSAETLAEPLHLYKNGPAMLYRNRPFGGVRGGGAGEYQGENRPYGAFLTYSLNVPGLPLPDEDKEKARKEAERAAARAKAQPGPAALLKEDPARPAEAEGGDARESEKEPKVEIRITDAAGKLIRKMEGPAKMGINRVAWDYGRDSFRRPPTDNRGRPRLRDSGPIVGPGTYDITVKYKDREAKGTLQVTPDPALTLTDADWQSREAGIVRAGELQNAVVDAINRVGAARDDVKVVLAKIDARKKQREQSGASGEAKDDPDKDLAKAARDLQKKLTGIEKQLYVAPDTKGIVEDETALNYAEYAVRVLDAAWEKPSPTALARLKEAETSVKSALAEFNKLFAEDVAAFRQKVAEAKIDLLATGEPIEVK